jgi:hypothetical protein
LRGAADVGRVAVVVATRGHAPEPRLFDTVDFPTDRDELFRRAQFIDAPRAVLEAISRLRGGTFRSLGDLVDAVEAITTT